LPRKGAKGRKKDGKLVNRKERIEHKKEWIAAEWHLGRWTCVSKLFGQKKSVNREQGGKEKKIWPQIPMAGA